MEEIDSPITYSAGQSDTRFMDAPLILKGRVLLREGEANGLHYPFTEIAPLADELNKPPPSESPEDANRDSLFLDHGDGITTWVGLVKNFVADDQDKALRGDVHIVDSDLAGKIQFQIDEGRSRFGISPRLLVDRDGETARALKMKSFSLVLNPAGGEELMLWSGEVYKLDDAKRIVLGPVLVPDEVDLQGEFINADEIEKTAHGFVKGLVYGKVRPGEMHKNFEGDIQVVESYLMPCDGIINGRAVAKGTWMLGVHIPDDEVWRKVRTGVYKGFSVGGYARKIPTA